ncbi:MAG TPA: energy transducer TonB [Usitatibacter sp.]|nr:energy transducer TonB [Usitatibacter sp.]
MNPRAALTCVLAFAALPATAAGDVDFYTAQSAGRPEQFVTPDYPREALARGVTGYVDVDASVDGLFALHDVHFAPGSPEAQVFVPGLREVAKFWMFHPGLRGDDCLPSLAQRISFRVIYEIESGAPHISLELSKAAGKTTKALDAQCPAPRYPGGALREGMLANVFARVDIRADGTVSQVRAEAYPEGAYRFAEEVESSLRRCRFAPAENPGRPRAACYDVSFRTGR